VPFPRALRRRLRLNATSDPQTPFPSPRPHDVYHSFPALFCAGDSRIVERSFVTWFRRGRVAIVTRAQQARLPQLDAATPAVAAQRPQAADDRPNPYP
jgi:hypothetical protein